MVVGCLIIGLDCLLRLVFLVVFLIMVLVWLVLILDCWLIEFICLLMIFDFLIFCNFCEKVILNMDFIGVFIWLSCVFLEDKNLVSKVFFIVVVKVLIVIVCIILV